MMINIYKKHFFSLVIILLNSIYLIGQEVPIINYSINDNGQVQLEVNSTTQNYYILKVRHSINSPFEITASMTLGEVGTTIISEPLEHYPIENYQVLEYSINTPFDTDGDGVDDITEYNNIPTQSPLNAAQPITPNNGLLFVDSFTTFKRLSVTKDLVQWSEFLNGKGFMKYIIVDFDTNPQIYFIDSEQHVLHSDFAAIVGIDILASGIKKGQVIYLPSSISNNGTLGSFAFNFSNGFSEDFDVVQRMHELLASNMPFLENNLSYYITENNDDQYQQNISLFQNSRVPVLFEADVYADIDYLGLNPAEGFGFFRQISLDEVPGSKDIVLYESLPNALPRVGGIMTSVLQTPLSHVNLRAIQNKVPNAFIRDPLAIDSIANLLNKYIYFKVEQDEYFIREATLDEVNAWFDDIRPKEEQIPPLNLDYKEILPLADIEFSMFDGFGAKCANIATMRTFGFPDGTIPDGFGIPFYFYQEFMKYNSFFEEIETIMNDPDFIADRVVRDQMLADFRAKIEVAAMPIWMLNELSILQQSFPTGTSIRCRSSTNNEDLPNFNGAGLYDSKTQRPSEGHLSKSIKQVYASLWNLRAYEERDFYRVNHFIASMGILCHPNFDDEKVNGVGVSTDPIYNTDNTFYLNSQVGENLITNPGNQAIPEEILLDKVAVSSNDFIVIQRSNLVPSDSTIFGEPYISQMRDYLTTIHDEFAILYEAVDNPYFAMDIEYKITADDQLIIKQARPWVSYILQEDPPVLIIDNFDFNIFPNPVTDYMVIECTDCALNSIQIRDITGRLMRTQNFETNTDSRIEFFLSDFPSGVYILSGFVDGNSVPTSRKFIKF